jgi:hypothetical protein
MSSTTNDGRATEETAPLAYAEDAERLNLPTAGYAKAPSLPIGVYGETRYGQCRSLTKDEIAAEAGKADVPDVEKTEA